MSIILYYSGFSRQREAITIRVNRQTDRQTDTDRLSNSNIKSDFKGAPGC